MSERGDAAGFGGGGGGVTRCGADKGLQGPCIAFLSFVPQPRGRQLVGSRVHLRPPPPTSHMGVQIRAIGTSCSGWVLLRLYEVHEAVHLMENNKPIYLISPATVVTNTQHR